MSSADNAAVLAALSSPDQAQQLSALRALKNDIVGHTQKKEKWLEAGALKPVVQICETSRSVAAKDGRRDSRGQAQSAGRPLTGDEVVRLQALQILASFANDGSAFLAPLTFASAFSVILSNISPTENPPQVVIAALRATINIAEVTVQDLPASAPQVAGIANAVFAAPFLGALRQILTNSVTSQAAQTQKNLVVKLITLICREEQHQMILANSGILDALATILVSIIIARGYALPWAEAKAWAEGVNDLLPEPAAANTDVPFVLGAINAIIGESQWRAAALVYAPAILTIFPRLPSPLTSSSIQTCATAFEMAGLSSVGYEDWGTMDCLLPLVPDNQSKSGAHRNFPPLGSAPSKDVHSTLRSTPYHGMDSPSGQLDESLSSSREAEVTEAESPLIPWLIYAVRRTQGLERVMAASLLATIFKAGFADRFREAYIGRLIVPILLQVLDNIGPTSGVDEPAFTDAETATNRFIVEKSLAVLAKFVVDCDYLQTCAFDCSAVKIISAFLKAAYEPLSVKIVRPWSPTPEHEKSTQLATADLTRVLGDRGQPPLLAHHIRVREAALKAVAALAGKDEYGKAFVEQDLVAYLVESLARFPSKPVQERPRSPKIFLGHDDGSRFDAMYGANPEVVIVAACHALRTLSRSVSILRTALQDSGVASPAFRLLRHPSLEVQIAASALMCNLVTNVSPMRERLTNVGVMRLLCEQSRSQNPVLRLNALWALKNWVGGASIVEKKECIDELTPGWLVRLIREDTEDDALYQRTLSQEAQPTVDADQDVEMGQAELDDTKAPASAPQEPASQPRKSPLRTLRLLQAEKKVEDLREAEVNPVRKVRDDDLAIQEQGLNLLRNLIGPVNSTTETPRDHAEMIDYLFSVLNQDQFFDIIHSKLQLKVLHPFGRRYSGSRQESRVLYPQPRIVAIVVYILVHLAASLPRHRQVLISQTKLLTDLGKHFSSKDKEVRVALCHLITNLTWRDDADDEESSAARAGELKKLGLLTRLEVLETADGELDVRERAKAAVWQSKSRVHP